MRQGVLTNKRVKLLMAAGEDKNPFLAFVVRLSIIRWPSHNMLRGAHNAFVVVVVVHVVAR
jgi:hypothetical protein